jgi:hypothetical protein
MFHKSVTELTTRGTAIIVRKGRKRLRYASLRTAAPCVGVQVSGRRGALLALTTFYSVDLDETC